MSVVRQAIKVEKYIIMAKYQTEIFTLMRNTKKALDEYVITWDSEHIDCVGSVDVVDENIIANAINNGDMCEVDDLIMSSEVPLGGMVVLFNGKTQPMFGFVCGNGNDWFIVNLPKYVKDAFHSFKK